MSESNWWANQDALIAAVEGDSAALTTAQKNLLETLATGLQAAFTGPEHMGRQILRPATGFIEEIFDGGKNPIFPLVTPLISITDIRNDEYRVFGVDTIRTDLVPTIVGDAIYFSIVPDYAEKTVKLSYVGGYTAVPPDILRVFWVELRTEWKRRKDPHLASISVAGSSVSVSQAFGLSEETKRALDPYRAAIPVFGGG